MRYRCDKCGDTIYVDPGESAIPARRRSGSKQKNRKTTMRGGERHGEMLLLRDRSAERSV